MTIEGIKPPVEDFETSISHGQQAEKIHEEELQQILIRE